MKSPKRFGRVEGRVTALESKLNKYGVTFSGSNPIGTRIYDAVGLSANVAVDGEAVVNNFDDINIFDRSECNVEFDATTGEPTVLAYDGDPDFKRDGSNGEVFYECTPFYWNKSFEEPIVSAYDLDELELAPMFKNGYDKVYLPSYWMATVDGKATSRTGTIPGNYSANTGVDAARTYNSNAHTETLVVHMCEYVLQLVEFATKDLQTVMMGASSLSYNGSSDLVTAAETGVNRVVVANAIAGKYVVGQTIVIGTTQNGSDIANNVQITAINDYDASNKAISFSGDAKDISIGYFLSSRAWINGATDIVVASSGSPGDNTSGKYPCKWRGKVDPWANAYSGLCDILIQRSGTEGNYTYTPYLINDPRNYAAGVITGDYEVLDFILPTSDGYATSLGQDGGNPIVGLTDVIGASSTTYLSGYYYYPRYDVCVVFVGGCWTAGRTCSPVYFSCSLPPSHSDFFRLARLFVSRD
jgi:hypothetical protein